MFRENRRTNLPKEQSKSAAVLFFGQGCAVFTP
jgi:hypothetical protein